VIGLRVLTPDDWRVWRQMRLASLAEAPYAFGSRLEDWLGDGDREERWRARLSIPGSYHVAAEIDGDVVGVAGGLPTPDGGVVELISMWVRPEARGRGVGDALVEAVEGWARRTGASTVRLAVAEGNDRAEALYRRHGYRRTGEVDRMPDGVRREYAMAKPLDPVPGGRVEPDRSGPVEPGQAGPVRPSGDGRSRRPSSESGSGSSPSETGPGHG